MPDSPRVPFLETLEDRLTPSGNSIGDLVVFGDSLSDVGNTYIATLLDGEEGTTPNDLYSQGRFSNGPIWVETLAEYLGEEAPTAALAGGLDYAFAGSTVAIPTAENPYGTPSIGDQVLWYLFGADATPGTADDHVPQSDDVFALWAGANDFFASAAQGADFVSPEQSADAVQSALATLIAFGGEHFVVANLPPLGETPYFQDLLAAGLITQAQVDGANNWAAGFNYYLAENLAELEAQHGDDGVTIAYVDVAGIFTNTLTKTNNGLGLKDFDSAVGPYDEGGFLTDITAKHPRKYLFWDSVHPGTVAQQYIGLHAAAGALSDLGVKVLTVDLSNRGVDPTDGGLSLREALNVIQIMPGAQFLWFTFGDHGHGHGHGYWC